VIRIKEGRILDVSTESERPVEILTIEDQPDSPGEKPLNMYPDGSAFFEIDKTFAGLTLSQNDAKAVNRAFEQFQTAKALQGDGDLLVCQRRTRIPFPRNVGDPS
jgi:hypothetical protein